MPRGVTGLITYFWLRVVKKVFTGENKKGFFEK